MISGGLGVYGRIACVCAFTLFDTGASRWVLTRVRATRGRPAVVVYMFEDARQLGAHAAQLALVRHLGSYGFNRFNF